MVYRSSWRRWHGEATGELNALMAKAKYVHGLPSAVKFGLVAKRIREKQKLRAAGYLAYDVEDF